MPMQLAVVSLWSLLEACRVGSDAEQQHANRTAWLAVCELASADGSTTLDLIDSQLTVDGLPAVSGIDTFAAAHGLQAFFEAAAIARVQFAVSVAADALLDWARLGVATCNPASWPAGIDVQRRCDVAAADVMAPQPRSRPAAEEPDSRLRSVFLQHRLIAGLPSIAGVAAMTAKLVIQGVVDRLLQVPGGLEPLMLLQQDEALLRRSIAVAVLSVVFARRAGWPVEQLADLGAAGLLHDLGAIIDPESPGPASFRWLLERGNEDFWLRSALIARRWHDGAAASSDPAGPLAVIAIVRLAVLAYDRGEAFAFDACDNVAVPAELMAIAKQALAATT